MRFTSQAILCAMSNTHIQYKQETVHQLHAQTQTLPFFANFNVISIFFWRKFYYSHTFIVGYLLTKYFSATSACATLSTIAHTTLLKAKQVQILLFRIPSYKFTWIDNTNPNTYPFKLCKCGYFSTFVLYYWFIIYVKWLLPYLVCGSRSLGFKMNP